MNPTLAVLFYAVGIAGLFYLNRDESHRTSRALWLPVIWFWITGSRAVSVWLNGGTVTAAQMREGSSTDTVVFLVLLVSGLAVLARRGDRPFSEVAANW